jgi:hypothetical protein
MYSDFSGIVAWLVVPSKGILGLGLVGLALLLTRFVTFGRWFLIIGYLICYRGHVAVGVCVDPATFRRGTSQEMRRAGLSSLVARSMRACRLRGVKSPCLMPPSASRQLPSWLSGILLRQSSYLVEASASAS